MFSISGREIASYAEYFLRVIDFKLENWKGEFIWHRVTAEDQFPGKCGNPLKQQPNNSNMEIKFLFKKLKETRYQF